MKNERTKLVKNLRYLCLIGVCVFGLITIVGTGGGGDEDGAGYVDTNQPLALNSGNAEGVTGLTLDAARGAVTAGSLGTGLISSADVPDGNSFDVNVLRISQNVLDRVLAMEQRKTPVAWMPRAVPAPDPQTIVPCDNNIGQVTITYDDADNDGEVSVYDSAVLLYQGCSALDLVLNGEVTVGVLDLLGDPPTLPWAIRLRLNFDSLTATDGGSAVGVSGTLDVTVNALANGTVLTTITTEVQPPGGGQPASSLLHFEEGDDFIQLTLFTFVLEETSPGGDFFVTAQGTLESSLIGGTVTFETPQPLAGTNFDASNPSSGELQILGSANSSILMRVLDAVDVELDVDDDGDGSVDVTLDSDWSTLEAAADVL